MKPAIALATLPLIALLAFTLGGCATDPQLSKAAQWHQQEERRAADETEAQAIRDAAARTGNDDNSLDGMEPVGAAPDFADPWVQTPYGRYRLSVLKKAVQETQARRQ